MSFALVAHTIAGSTSNAPITTSGIDTTGASLLVVEITDFTGGSTTLTDNKGNTWVGRTAKSDSGGGRCRIYDCVTPTVGPGHTFTATPAGTSVPSIGVMAWSGSAVSPFDRENGTGASLSPGSVTPAADNALVIQALDHEAAAGAVSISGSYTISDSIGIVGGSHFGSSFAYWVQTTATATNPTWTTGGAATLSSSVCAVYLAATGGGGGAVSPRLPLLGVG